MNSPRRLGRGLEALLGQPFGNWRRDRAMRSLAAPQLAEIPTVEMNGLTQLSVYEIDSNPYPAAAGFRRSRNRIAGPKHPRAWHYPSRSSSAASAIAIN